MVFILYFKTNNVTAAIHRIEYQKKRNICMDIMDKKLEFIFSGEKSDRQ